MDLEISQLENEVARLQRDNAMLVRMIEKIPEYRNWVDDYRASGGLTYLPSERRSHHSIYEHEEDPANWVPLATVDVVDEAVANASGRITKQVLMDTVHELDEIWKRRERAVIARVKKECEEKILRNKRAVDQGVSSDTVYLKQRVQYLQKQLNKTKGKTSAAKRERIAEEMEQSILDSLAQQVDSYANALAATAGGTTRRARLAQLSSHAHGALLHAPSLDVAIDHTSFVVGEINMAHTLVLALEESTNDVFDVIQELDDDEDVDDETLSKVKPIDDILTALRQHCRIIFQDLVSEWDEIRDSRA